MNVYSDAGYNELVLSDFTVLPATSYRAENSLETYSDDELLSELAWRLRGRT